MTVEDMKLAFAKNLRELMDGSNNTQEDIAKICGVSQQTVSDWLTGKKYPRMDKVQSILDHFNIPMTALVNDGKGQTEQYYLNPETAELAQMLHDNPQYKVMFDATRDLDPESVKKIIDFINYQRHLEGYED